MNAPRKPPLFAAALGALALVALGEGGWLFERVQAARQAEANRALKRRELHSVAASVPAPTAANAALIEADLARTNRVLAQLQDGLRGRGPAVEAMRAAAVPVRRAEAYFDIATFVEKMRELAQHHGVALRAGEHFGFAEHANAGPEADLIPAVHRARLITEHLLVALFAAHPRHLLSVQRERPSSGAESTAGANRSGPRASSAGTPDYFEIDPRVSARVPGMVETAAFRLVFEGPTSVLRAWLNQLAVFELPLVVRSVEVEPAGATTEAAPAGPAVPGASPPLVKRTYSRFTVTVEFIDLVPPLTER